MIFLNILMVYPSYPETFWSFKHALKFISKSAALPPLGLLTIASYLPKEWNVKLIDMNYQKLQIEDIVNSDYIFISAMAVQRESAKKVIKICNDLKIPIVAGGPLFTMEPDTFQDSVDYFVLGEAEEIMEELVNDMQEKSLKRYYAKPNFCDIGKTLPPRWSLLNIKKYGSMSIQYSRGCPYNCEFCDISALNGKKPRTKNDRQVIYELQTLYETGWRRSVFFVDDNFISNKSKLKKEILPEIIKWQKEHDYPFSFYTEVSIDFSNDDELMNLMHDAGFDRVFIGLETPDVDSLKEANKYQNLKKDLQESIKKIQSHGFEIQGGFIVGFDNDKPTIFDKMFEFIQNNGIVTAMVGILNAPRGSELYNRLLKENRLKGEISGNNVDVNTNIIPKMNFDFLINNYKNLMNKLYSPKYYYARMKKFLVNYIAPNNSKPKIGLQEIKAFIKSIFVLGIFGKERKHYWKTFFWGLFKKPQAFPKFITLSIYGYHFRKISSKL
ncbi:B12-binding domain-containing radical SAM protein [Petrotoga sp. 9PW.55.5.1]|uniref:B12-binding domain-containing radical SAM protein n=1 Tax=Petrotoga sp. 9PW.55.5.1 TaxID=1308979 RepID=UPI00351A319E